ncbi:unnamed protein product (macronuclear) [Paramecium tetraurelia]|uniref:non-specific serine/threonine protein kinase n=1 Tax=Paramecium tetraurelia TaxID=5888 RepID=A0C1N1_PARTE|nr:uncharacterized protein GSPATT00034175001 [Paramecium tetraurelia]CAK64698.1 unnamed protein product [Paramecium tetraurelia]|eukprot:XP_001432095.1 hypothetical protein (macronuclear) [Paramecium tetraurelia strain d4-2]
MDQLIGTTVNGYQFIKQLGTGSMAEQQSQLFKSIYLVQDKTSQLNYVAKVYTCLNSDIRCHNEAIILEKLSHPNIITIKRNQQIKLQGDQGEMNSLILEYLEKGDLFEFIAKSGHFGESLCRYYFRQLVQVVDFIHKNGFVHRNLKLESILLDRKFNLKLCNFSCAQHQNKYKDGKLKTKVGTENYQAPEVLYGAVYNGVKADVFSLGVILFIMYKGQPPFLKANQQDALFNLIIQEDYKQFWEIHSQKKIEFHFDFKYQVIQGEGTLPENGQSEPGQAIQYGGGEEFDVV